MPFSSAETSFRQQFSSWSARPTAAAAPPPPPPPQPFLQLSDFSASNISTTFKSINPFKQQGYMQLPVSENDPAPTTIQEPAWFTMSRWDRIVCFGVCLAASAIFFVLCFALFPVLVLKPIKFAMLWSLGSLLFVISFGCLQGPVNYIIHLFSANRILFTVVYFGSIILTLVFSLGMGSKILTVIACIVQIIAALWYTISYFPMGTQGLRFASRMGIRQVNGWLDS
ncbi:protein transport protein SFT2 [Kockiozyma suomiensis]|uniref:protein transport protein SFT2 n=1 Tax=Kockiozyma suomiensis TaxID=1337062 RepID=UPI003343C819